MPEELPDRGLLPPTDPQNAELRFSYRGWEVVVRLDGTSGEGCVAGHAEVHAGNYTCRLVLASPHYDSRGALNALAQKARDLIEDREALAATSSRDPS